MIQNTGKLAGKTVFITGASRGIGKAIALKVARDGANVVIAAKTVEPNPKLPGTIYTAAEEVEAVGGKCLPCIVDIREEEQIKRAVEAAVQKFGGIDILINNASAISLTGTLDTSMKKYDLMHQVNTRGTFLTTKYCIPYLKVGHNPHILNLSPPLNLNPYWFKNHTAYTMAKYGMSMCVLGMSEEFREDGVAVNALWPRTSIATAAVNMLGGKDMMDSSRKVDIMSDAAYIILCKDSRSYTGNFAIDDNVLREVGVKNFDDYAVAPGSTLQTDFFLDEAIPGGGAGETTPAKPAAPGGGAPTVQDIFKALGKSITPELVRDVGLLYKFNVTGNDAAEWYINLKDSQGEVTTKIGNSKVDLEVTIGSGDLVSLFQGRLKPAAAYMSGKLKIKGDLAKAMKLEKVFSRYKANL